jgi:hypothetical protein
MKARIVEAAGQESSVSCRPPSAGTWRYRALLLVAAAMTMLVSRGWGQTSQPDHPHPILLPEANHLPDINDQMKLHDQNSKKQNFEAANAERKRELDDASTKLLILARDLKQQTDNMGSSPLTRKALREAEVIEMLARDVKEKMKLTVGGS